MMYIVPLNVLYIRFDKQGRFTKSKNNNKKKKTIAADRYFHTGNYCAWRNQFDNIFCFETFSRACKICFTDRDESACETA